MKRLFYIFAVLLSVSCADDAEQISVIPQPLCVRILPGTLNLSGAVLEVDGTVSQETAEAIEGFVSEFSDSSFTVSGSKAQVCFRMDSNLPSEAYEISVSRKRLLVKASSFRGFLYAM